MENGRLPDHIEISATAGKEMVNQNIFSIYIKSMALVPKHVPPEDKTSLPCCAYSEIDIHTAPVSCMSKGGV